MPSTLLFTNREAAHIIFNVKNDTPYTMKVCAVEIDATADAIGGIFLFDSPSFGGPTSAPQGPYIELEPVAIVFATTPLKTWEPSSEIIVKQGNVLSIQLSAAANFSVLMEVDNAKEPSSPPLSTPKTPQRIDWWQ